MKPCTLWIAIAGSLFLTTPAFAQSDELPIPSDAADIINSLHSDLHKKLEQLSELLDQNIKAGKITDAQIQQQLTSGRLEQTIRSLGLEANQLLDEIQADMKNGDGSGKGALLPLLGTLTGTGK